MAESTQISDRVIYCLVAKNSGFSQAARTLGLSRSMVSKRIARLESRLGVRLINRSTRSFSLTEAGQLLRDRYSDINDRVDHAEREVADLGKSHSGTIRLAMPVAYAYSGMPIIADLRRRFPNIDVRLSIIDDDFDLIESGFDAALHIGDLRSSNLVSRRITTLQLAVCASPAYLDEHGVPATPDELLQHNCLRMPPRQGGAAAWPFRSAEGKPFTVNVSGDFIADSQVVLLQACIEGIGICQLPPGLVGRHVARDELRLILDPFVAVARNINVVMPHRDAPEKVRAVIDFLTGQLSTRLAAGTGV